MARATRLARHPDADGSVQPTDREPRFHAAHGHRSRTAFRTPQGAVADLLRVPRRRDRRPAGPERRRQVDAARHPRDAAGAVHRPCGLRRAHGTRAGAALRGRLGHARPRSLSLSGADGAREPAFFARLYGARAMRLRDVEAAPRRTRTSPIAPTIRCWAFRAACASGWRSSARSSTRRGCCCSTSRSRDSIRRRRQRWSTRLKGAAGATAA